MITPKPPKNREASISGDQFVITRNHQK